jgi:hypothetical protein
VRDIPDVPFPGWDPPPYRVDDRGKVIGAEPGPRNNWGRFGELDQIGSASHLTPERVAAAATTSRSGSSGAACCSTSLVISASSTLIPDSRSAPTSSTAPRARKE